jgi:hypothetical protein
MNKSSRQASISDLLADHALITAAIRRAARAAVLAHAQAGHPVATCQNGEVVWVPAQEVLARLSGDGRPVLEAALGDLPRSVTP